MNATKTGTIEQIGTDMAIVISRSTDAATGRGMTLAAVIPGHQQKRFVVGQSVGLKQLWGAWEGDAYEIVGTGVVAHHEIYQERPPLPMSDEQAEDYVHGLPGFGESL